MADKGNKGVFATPDTENPSVKEKRQFQIFQESIEDLNAAAERLSAHLKAHLEDYIRVGLKTVDISKPDTTEKLPHTIQAVFYVDQAGGFHEDAAHDRRKMSLSILPSRNIKMSIGPLSGRGGGAGCLFLRDADTGQYALEINDNTKLNAKRFTIACQTILDKIETGDGLSFQPVLPEKKQPQVRGRKSKKEVPPKIVPDEALRDATEKLSQSLSIVQDVRAKNKPTAEKPGGLYKLVFLRVANPLFPTPPQSELRETGSNSGTPGITVMTGADDRLFLQLRYSNQTKFIEVQPDDAARGGLSIRTSKHCTDNTLARTFQMVQDYLEHSKAVRLEKMDKQDQAALEAFIAQGDEHTAG